MNRTWNVPQTEASISIQMLVSMSIRIPLIIVFYLSLLLSYTVVTAGRKSETGH
jgi:hypothetical protein